jgi:hypothetical protein
VSETGQDFVVIPQEFLNGFCLGGRLNNYKILLHSQVYFGAKVEKNIILHIIYSIFLKVKGEMRKEKGHAGDKILVII